MAFQQPTRQAIQRPLRDEHDDHDGDQHQEPTELAGPLPTEASQTWVLFSPATDSETTTGASSSVLSSLPDSQPTPGRSRLSDLGSLDSQIRSNYASSYAQSASAATRPMAVPLSMLTSSINNASSSRLAGERAAPVRDQETEDDAELDSLDSHLADFRGGPASAQTHSMSTPLAQSYAEAFSPLAATTVNLPTHDGLGSFRFGQSAGMGSAVQEHLYAFEQFNPRRLTKRRRESLDWAQMQVDEDLAEEADRTRRIEEWRWEHSRVLLEEIQKQTRRRRGSEISRRSRSGASVAGDAMSSNAQSTAAATATTTAGDASSDWHDQEDDDLLRNETDNNEGNEGTWSTLTRKFMFEVMGIDDRILSLLFGENVVDSNENKTEEDATMDLSSTPKASDPHLAASAGLGGVDTRDARDVGDATQDDNDVESSSWQLRMIERIAKELGIFMHQHMSTHPGAFSTFVRVQQMPLPYAGLPVIPEALTPPEREVGKDTTKMAESGVAATKSATSASMPQFQPTISQAKPMAIPGAVGADSSMGVSASAASSSAATATAAGGPSTFTKEEWEQDLDIKLVFRYLRSRFLSDTAPSASNHPQLHRRGSTGSGANGASSSNNSNLSMQDFAAKAARVRQHHPLVGRNGVGQRAFRTTNLATATPTAAAGVAAAPTSPVLSMRHAPAPSCASQSTRRSARRSSVSSRHSSRHYWDIGGSIGTGSVIASAGPMGSWGEA